MDADDGVDEWHEGHGHNWLPTVFKCGEFAVRSLPAESIDALSVSHASQILKSGRNAASPKLTFVASGADSGLSVPGRPCRAVLARISGPAVLGADARPAVPALARTTTSTAA